MTATDFRTGRRAPAVVVLLLLAAAFAAHSPALKASFTQWDDPRYLTENPMVWGVTPGNVAKMFTSFVNGNYHPLPLLSYAVEYAFTGLDPFLYHLDNLLLHLANVALALLFLRRIGLSLWAALAAASLFALHPMGVEAVAWVVGRKDLLCTLFSLLCLVAYMRWADAGGGPAGRRFRALTWAFFALALLSKGTALTLPFLFLIVDALRGGSGRPLKDKLPFFAVAALFAVVAVFARASFQGELREESFGFGSMAVNAVYRFFCYYLFRVFVPVHNLFPPFTAGGEFSDPHFLLALLGILVLAPVAWSLRKRARPEVLGLLFYAVAIAPSLPLPVLGYSSDRFQYFPSVGLFLAIGWGFGRARERFAAPGFSRFATGLLVAVSAALAALTFHRAGVWHDQMTLADDAVRVFAGKSGQETNLARAYGDRGLEWLRRGNPGEARKDFERALSADPGHAFAYAGLGEILSGEGRLEEALGDYDRAILLDGNLAAAYAGRALVRLKRGGYAEALADANRAVNLAPESPLAYGSRGHALWAMGRLQEAAGDFTRVIELRPRNPVGYRNRALVYREMGRTEDCARDLEAVLRLAPEDAEAARMLGELRRLR